MPLAEMPVAVVMQRKKLDNPWVDHAWAVDAVLPSSDGPTSIVALEPTDGAEHYLACGIVLSLFRDENDGYFENWAAPEPKVFVMWRMQDTIAVPMMASVSYAEGTRMMDSGEQAEGVAMHPSIHEWLGAYLAAHYRPRARQGRAHG